ncbi:putative chaperon P13.9 [Tripterygium wilfordii]|uniref:Putative chaperon P13.9 n=1 Tax=Tripterygium wilfordii TaxID=458696 RepID=A0A7J7D6R4_TRIWF|nr:protein BUNDLE SHEATH DEFECTIVE 2, chloroplastic [Tripterygium wilfordii]KAF5741988.1 putative chaperon P13.9 [Tripterygium wilfordii]
MANSLCLSPICSFQPLNKPGTVTGFSIERKSLQVNELSKHSRTTKFQTLEVKATNSNQTSKPNSIVCADCDGNGAVLCSQCKGNGVNSVDHFNGQFKAGGLCWLCRGKKDILCGNCNGAGFVGGFMSTHDD